MEQKMSLLDPLYCQEESLELEEERMGPMLPLLEKLNADCHLLPAVAGEEEEWTELLCSLATKDEETRPGLLPDGGGGGGDGDYLLSARREAVEWVVGAAAHHGFSALTVLFAVNYLDRCFLPSAGAGGLRLQRDKLWMRRLAAAACLSLAAKLEETHVPLLLELQVAAPPETEENGFVFEAKTIRRMELLVLSALGWRMNPVTPLSFIHHLLPRLCSDDNNTALSTTNDATSAVSVARIRGLLNSCETVLLSVLTDWRWVRYPASMWAAAALLHTAEAGGGTHHLISLLNLPKDKVEECYQLIVVCGGGVFGRHKRKHSSSSFYHNANYSSPPSPKWVIGSCFSWESSSSSGDSCAMWPSLPDIRASKAPNCSVNRASHSK